MPVCLQNLFSHGASMPVRSLGLLASRYVHFNEVVKLNLSIQYKVSELSGQPSEFPCFVVAANEVYS